LIANSIKTNSDEFIFVLQFYNMSNEIIIYGRIYKLESIWRCSKTDNSKDIKGNIFPYPKEEKKWSGQLQFLNRLKEIQKYLKHDTKKYIKLSSDKCKNCMLCDANNITTKQYILDKYIWDTGLMHYIKNHNIKPSEGFIEKLFNYNMPADTSIKLSGRLKINSVKNINFLKLEKNQLMILDALMRHGGYNKKYHDSKKKDIIRYSEHAGFLDVRDAIIHNVIVSGNTLRVDRGDEEIFLPVSTPDAFNYEYIFHTHPPTPKPGGRAGDGILYEFPSIGDIFHFIDHYNEGHTIGSLVMTSEGLYNIRKLEHDNTKIKIDEDKMYSETKKTFKDVQAEYLNKYGSKFTTYYFYSTIAQDTSFVNKVNTQLKKYHITIDFYPRSKDFKGSWIVDTIYIPIYKNNKF
jgi:hypothetical protein